MQISLDSISDGIFIIYSKKVHWSIWPAIGLCVLGVYFLSDFSNSQIMLGDGLVILCSVFWALHIIYAGKFMEVFNIPIFEPTEIKIAISIIGINIKSKNITFRFSQLIYLYQYFFQFYFQILLIFCIR